MWWCVTSLIHQILQLNTLNYINNLTFEHFDLENLTLGCLHWFQDRSLAHDEDKRTIGNRNKPKKVGPTTLDAGELLEHSSYNRPNGRNQILPLGRKPTTSVAWFLLRNSFIYSLITYVHVNLTLSLLNII